MHNPSAPQVKVREPDWSESNTDIVHLNTANFDAVLKDAASVLVMFYAPCKLLVVSNHLLNFNFYSLYLGCGHCKRMKPEFETAAAQMKQEGV